jgi:hypothetical protein
MFFSEKKYINYVVKFKRNKINWNERSKNIINPVLQFCFKNNARRFLRSPSARAGNTMAKRKRTITDLQNISITAKYIFTGNKNQIFIIINFEKNVSRLLFHFFFFLICVYIPWAWLGWRWCRCVLMYCSLFRNFTFCFYRFLFYFGLSW